MIYITVAVIYAATVFCYVVIRAAAVIFQDAVIEDAAPERMIRRHRVRSRAGGVIYGDQSGGGDLPGSCDRGRRAGGVMGAAIGAGADDLMGVVSGAVAVIFQGAAIEDAAPVI